MKKIFSLLIAFALLFSFSCANTTGQNADVTASLVFSAFEEASSNAEKTTANRAQEIMDEFEIDSRGISADINNVFETKDGSVKIVVRGSLDFASSNPSLAYKVDFKFNNFGFSETVNGNDYTVKLNGHVRSTLKANLPADGTETTVNGKFVIKSVTPINIDAAAGANSIAGLLSFNVKATASASAFKNGVKVSGKINGNDISQELEFDFTKLVK